MIKYLRVKEEIEENQSNLNKKINKTVNKRGRGERGRGRGNKDTKKTKEEND
jgi:hypothetical protein